MPNQNPFWELGSQVPALIPTLSFTVVIFTSPDGKIVVILTSARLRPEPDYLTGTGAGIPVPVCRNRIWEFEFRFW